MLCLLTLAVLLELAYGAKLPPRIPQKIVGGVQIDITEQPHQIALEQSGYQVCGGSIIGESFVVTAAHCTDGASAKSFQIRAGSSELESGGIIRQVSKMFQHPQYNSFNIDYDITVLYLQEPLIFSEAIQPIALADVRPQPGTEAITSGWGVLNEDDWWGPEFLQAVTIAIISQEDCRKAYGDDSITDRMICAGVPEGGKDHCYGDSGGPLVANSKLVGIVSWAAGCARPGYPGVSSSIVELRQFILDSIEEALLNK